MEDINVQCFLFFFNGWKLVFSENVHGGGGGVKLETLQGTDV